MSGRPAIFRHFLAYVQVFFVQIEDKVFRQRPHDHRSVLELTYTAHDMAPFARDLGYVDETGNIKAPFIWDEERRLRLRAKLDAVYFHLYGVTDRDDVRYIYSTFPKSRSRSGRIMGPIGRSTCALPG